MEGGCLCAAGECQEFRAWGHNRRWRADRTLKTDTLEDHLAGREPKAVFSVLTETAKIDIRIPRDREGAFDPKRIQRDQRRFPVFDDKIVSMYARDFDGPRGRARDPGRMAEPAAGDELPAGFLRRDRAVFPQAAVQTCIVHLIRNSMDFVSWKTGSPSSPS